MHYHYGNGYICYVEIPEVLHGYNGDVLPVDGSDVIEDDGARVLRVPSPRHAQRLIRRVNELLRWPTACAMGDTSDSEDVETRAYAGRVVRALSAVRDELIAARDGACETEAP